MIKNRTVISSCLIVVILFMLQVNMKYMDRYQHSYRINNLVADPEIPVSVAITTVALGPLRSILVDTLWWRALRHQDQGDYFDAIQLAHWIARLQPTYASIWSFLGWNMAYNIAHDFPKKEDRWQWIERSIKLLRDEGLLYNPDNTIIRHEIARIFYDRIGNNLDPDSDYLKNQWAFKMMTYFSTSSLKELTALNSATATVEELKQRPDVAIYLAEAEKQGIEMKQLASSLSFKYFSDITMSRELQEKAATEIYYYFRRFRIENDLKMDVKKILFINEEYGPLDWRLHQAHAIYWAAEDTFDAFLKSGVNYAELVRQSMIDAFYEGYLFHDPEKNIITRTSNLHIIGKIHDFVEYMLENEYSHRVDVLHREFLERAIPILSIYNRREWAYDLFEHYKADYLPEKSISFNAFITKNIKKVIRGNGKSSRSLLEASLYQHFFWLNTGDYDQSNGYLDVAQRLWQEEQIHRQKKEQALLPPFEKLLSSAKQRFFQAEETTPSILEKRGERAKKKQPNAVYIGTFE